MICIVKYLCYCNISPRWLYRQNSESTVALDPAILLVLLATKSVSVYIINTSCWLVHGDVSEGHPGKCLEGAHVLLHGPFIVVGDSWSFIMLHVEPAKL